MKPRERRHITKREFILATALELILDKGLENFSLRKLAKHVDYSPAGLYEFFKNKDEIIDELHKNGFSLLTQILKSASKGADPKSNLREIGLAYLAFARENSELYQLIFTHISSKNRTIKDLATGSESFNILCYAMQKLVKRKDPAQTIESLSYSYWAMLHGLSILPLTIINHFENDFKLIQKNAIDIYINGLLEAIH